MANLTRREFLLSLAAMPALGLRLPQLMTLTPGSGQARQGDPGQPNFIIMVFDTFSARHLPLRGYPRDTTPNISRLAERATVFHNHYAGGNYTTPGTASARIRITLEDVLDHLRPSHASGTKHSH